MNSFFSMGRETDNFTHSLRQAKLELSDLSKMASTQLSSTQKAIKETSKAADGLADSLGSSLMNAFEDVLLKGNSFSSVIKNLSQSLSKTVLSSALAPIQNALGNAASGLFEDGLSNLLPFAKGGVFTDGRVRPFAKGGVVSSPTYFPMQNGATGLMGEAGSEAIMPLTRGADGRLGVTAGGGGAGNSSVIINISTPNVESFKRSSSQISASLARAVDRGRRHQ